MKRVAVWLMLGLLGGCDDHVLGEGLYEATCRDDPPLTWENYGKGALDHHCNGCHSQFMSGENRSGAPEGVDFDTWDGAVEYAERIRIRVIESETMPPSGGLTPDERALLDEWLKCELIPASGGL